MYTNVGFNNDKCACITYRNKKQAYEFLTFLFEELCGFADQS